MMQYESTDDYPATCTVDVEALNELVARFCNSDDGYGDRIDQTWPVTDNEGNVFPIFYTPDDVDDRGDLTDSHGNTYRPFTGNLEPTEYGNRGVCNTPVNNWRDRYHQIRYCDKLTIGDNTFCSTHSRIDPSGTPTMTDTATLGELQSAEEVMQTGLSVQTLDHYYSNVDPLKRLLGWGDFEALMGESNYEFGIEYQPKTFDFADAEITPQGVDDDGTLTVKCGYPTEHVDRALSLFCAAMMGIQMITVQPRIMHEDEDAGQRMMETKTIEHAQLTSPTESDPSQDYKTLETWSEHHLNLPLSRIIRDRPDLLEYGGVGVDVDEGSDTIDEDDVVLEIQADAEDVETVEGGTDPNAFDGNKAPSEEIVDKASGE